LDLSTTTDISALVLAFPEEEDFKILSYFWVPKENIRIRARRDRVPYDLWTREGYIEATEGEVIDYDVIRKRLKELAETYEIKEIAIDPWNAQQLATQLAETDGFNVVMFRQGYATMSSACKDVLALILSQRLQHNGNPVMRWMARNIAVQQDAAGNIKPAKDKSSERIDGIVAMIMAGSRALCAVEAEKSIYNERGLLVL